MIRTNDDSSAHWNGVAFSSTGTATATSITVCGRHAYDPRTVKLARGSNQHRKTWTAPCYMCGYRIEWRGAPPKHWKPEP